MSSLVTQMFIAERYGLRLTVDQLAEVLGLTNRAVYNQVCKGTFPIATYVEAGKRWADYRAVAEHIDTCAKSAKVAA
jgi:hypothetical protein